MYKKDALIFEKKINCKKSSDSIKSYLEFFIKKLNIYPKLIKKIKVKS